MQELPKDSKTNAVIIGIPTLGMLSYQFAANAHGHMWPIFTSPMPIYVVDKPVDIARNEIAQTAINLGVQFVLFRDDDTIAPPDAPTKLLGRFNPYCRNNGLDPNAADSIVGGVVYSKLEPPTPMIYKNHVVGGFQDWHVGDLVECDIIGMGCTMIPTGMFKRTLPFVRTMRCINSVCINRYHIHYALGSAAREATRNDYQEIPPDKNCPNCREPLIPDWFKTIRDWDDDGHPAGCTEDTYFCRLVQESGGKVLVDCGVLCDHEVFDPKNPVSGTTYYGYTEGVGPRWIRGGKIHTWPTASSKMKTHEEATAGMRETLPHPLRVDVGNPKKKEGYITVDMTGDPDMKIDGRDLQPVVDKYGKIDKIISNHMLEHVMYREIPGVIYNWFRALKPGGEMEICVPDSEWACKEYLKDVDRRRASGNKDEGVGGFNMAVLLGNQDSEWDIHRSLFSQNDVTGIAEHYKGRCDSIEVILEEPGLKCSEGYVLNQAQWRIKMVKKNESTSNSGPEASEEHVPAGGGQGNPGS